MRPVSTRPPKTTKGKSAPPQTKAPSSTAVGPATERTGGCGGILILIDQSPGEDVEFIEEEVAAPVVPPTDQPIAMPAAPAAPSGPHIALDDSAPEAPTPASFDVSPVTLFSRQPRLTISLLVPV